LNDYSHNLYNKIFAEIKNFYAKNIDSAVHKFLNSMWVRINISYPQKVDILN